MERTELRIGNIIGRGYYNPHPLTPSYEIEYVVVKGVSESHANITSGLNTKQRIKMPYSSLKTIPLTEYWLIKFGFVKFYLDINLSKCENDAYWVRKDFAFQISNISFVLQKAEVKITSVHQLQNLYFALSNHELILSDDN